MKDSSKLTTKNFRNFVLNDWVFAFEDQHMLEMKASLINPKNYAQSLYFAVFC